MQSHSFSALDWNHIEIMCQSKSLHLKEIQIILRLLMSFIEDTTFCQVCVLFYIFEKFVLSEIPLSFVLKKYNELLMQSMLP